MKKCFGDYLWDSVQFAAIGLMKEISAVIVVVEAAGLMMRMMMKT
jgi:hypothetical protein